MLKYIFKRIVIFIPTLLVITLLGFIISINAPGDPVESMVVAPQGSGEIGSQTLNQIQQKKILREKLGLDLPVFYISLSSLSRPDTLYKIYNKNEREALDRLIDQYGNWPVIQEYYKSLSKFYDEQLKFIPDTNQLKAVDKNIVTETLNQVKFEALSLKSSHEPAIIDVKLNKLETLLSSYSFLSKFRQPLAEVKADYLKIKTLSSAWKNYIPKIVFYGTGNQYHR
ncbi:MAG: hypothetical protein ACXVP4_07440, partial [Bacteroidia bacterium]